MKIIVLKIQFSLHIGGVFDGSTCAIVFVVAGGLRENIRFSNPKHEESDELIENLIDHWQGPIIVADISISRELAKKINNTNVDITILDHHESAIPLAQYDWCEIEIENNRAGGKMLLEFFLRNDHKGKDGKLLKYRQLTDIADDHDRWIKKIPESNTLSILHNVLKQKSFINRFLKQNSMELTIQEEYLVEMENEKKKDYIEAAKKRAVVLSKQFGDETIRVAYLLANDYQSSLGHAIYSDIMMDVDVVVMVGSDTISMRSSKECPISLVKIVENFGGGGHRNSAGCSLGAVLGKDLLEMVISNLTIK